MSYMSRNESAGNGLPPNGAEQAHSSPADSSDQGEAASPIVRRLVLGGEASDRRDVNDIIIEAYIGELASEGDVGITT